MRTDLNKPLFVKLKYKRSRRDNCENCAFFANRTCSDIDIPCPEGHWEVDKVLPQSEATFDLLQLQDSINSVETKMKQFKSEMHQISEEVKEEPKYFY